MLPTTRWEELHAVQLWLRLARIHLLAHHGLQFLVTGNDSSVNGRQRIPFALAMVCIGGIPAASFAASCEQLLGQ